MTVLDLANAALRAAQARLGDHPEKVAWVTADATDWRPARTFDRWRELAAYHFFTDPEDCAR